MVRLLNRSWIVLLALSLIIGMTACKSQKKLASISQEVKVDPQRNFGFIGQFVNVRYDVDGEYLIKFYIDNKELGMHRFCVRKI